MTDTKDSDSDRLFVPLKSEFYTAFDAGDKDVELRGLSPRFNHKTVYAGRNVELRRGYSTDDSLWGEVGEVWLFPALRAIPSEIDHQRIAPYDPLDEFLTRATDILGDYDRFIAFSVEGIGRKQDTGSEQP